MRPVAEIAADLDRLLLGTEPLPEITTDEIAHLESECQKIPHGKDHFLWT